VLVRGELDLATAAEFEAAVAEQLREGRPVLLDLAELAFMDSSGVAGLHRLSQATAGGDPAFAIAATMRPGVRQVLEITGVLPLLPLESLEAPDG
jgi:anti-anti-sigma factor